MIAPGARLALALGAAGAALLAAARPDRLGAQPPAPESSVQVGVGVSPDTVTVGRPFLVSVRVRAPRGAAVRFPDGPDTTHVVQALDPPQLREGADTTAVDVTAHYRVAAWDVGERSVELAPVAVEIGGEAREVAVRSPTVFVRSVLPADTAARVPKPAREPWEFPRAWWLPWLLALLAAALVGLLAWWWWRRRRRRLAIPARLTDDPFRDAEENFARVEALRLLEAGERGRHVALMLDVMRDFLARRFPAASPALTSRELLAALADEPAVPGDRLRGVLHEGDLVKFARRPLTDDRARAFGGEARAVVHGVRDADLAAARARDAASADGDAGRGARAAAGGR